MFFRNWIRPLLLLAALQLSACYYVQAASGQMEVLRKREPIDELIKDPETPPEVVERLQLVAEARRFSIDELALPDNGSYASYSDLERDYVVWNVFAAGEFSLQPRTWCYPVVGCVSYRGYFKREKAERLAEKLRTQGYDVFTGGVAAYSTLGKFDDPVLNTMMHWDDTQLAGLLFHELAHQVLYIKDDTGFNEAFATAVEEFGVERFLGQRDQGEQFAKYEERKTMRRKIMALVGDCRDNLRAIYERDIADEEKRRLKARRLEELEEALRIEFLAAGRNADAWFQQPLNNARLLSLSLYEGLLPQFRQMLANCNDELECFYIEAKRVSGLDEDARQAAMDALLQ